LDHDIGFEEKRHFFAENRRKTQKLVNPGWAWSLIRNEKSIVSQRETLPCNWKSGKELPVIPANKVVDPKRIIGKNGGPRRRRGTRVADPPPPQKK
jgi:hypothetical protein